MQNICRSFPITNEEFQALDQKFGNLCHYASWQLYKKNDRANHTDEEEDMAQELKIALIRAGSYYKRQVYIENCLALVGEKVRDAMTKKVVAALQELWRNKTRHGAGKQKFGPHQEKLLGKLVKKLVPPQDRPSKREPLKIDGKFSTYCKAITWNAQKQMGKKITREKAIRSSAVSLSEFDYLGSNF